MGVDALRVDDMGVDVLEVDAMALIRSKHLIRMDFLTHQ